MKSIELICYFIEEELRRLEKLLDKYTNNLLNQSMSAEETTRDRFEHLIQSEIGLLSYIKPNFSNDEIQKTLRFSTIEEIKQSSRITLKQHLKTVKSLTEKDLDNVLTTSSDQSFPIYDHIFHFIQHLIAHRGQLSLKLRELL